MARTHGTPSCYVAGCRCPDCRTAARERRRRAPSRLRRGLPFACLDCPATFASARGLCSHRRVHPC